MGGIQGGVKRLVPLDQRRENSWARLRISFQERGMVRGVGRDNDECQPKPANICFPVFRANRP